MGAERAESMSCTAQHRRRPPGRIRGILVAVLDLVVAVALFTLFESVNRSISMMAAWFRAAYAAVYWWP